MKVVLYTVILPAVTDLEGNVICHLFLFPWNTISTTVLPWVLLPVKFLTDFTLEGFYFWLKTA